MESQQAGQRNSYLDEVVANQAQVQKDLQYKRRAMPPQGAPAPAAAAFEGGGGDVGRESGGAAVGVRITGFWRWKNVIVPPNALVVHTRRGEPEPLHIGLGVSFPFDPVKDSFLAVPATMQTILINARSICKERQGILIQGYVQWIIDDFKTAYRKLDFSDPEDPMRVVAVQLREQAEAAIKDKVATMSVDEVLADKQPIIRELTARLRAVAEGEDGGTGLGLKIVTVQIKEAVVSSSRLWETLQRPFRAERSKEARLAELENEAVVRRRETEDARARAQEEIERDNEIARLRAQAQASQFDREQTERMRRAKLEAEASRALLEHEREKLEAQTALARLKLDHKKVEQSVDLAIQRADALQKIELDAARRKIENDVSTAALQARLIQSLPQIVEKLPVPKELHTLTLGNDGLAGLAPLVQGVLESRKPKATP